MTELKKTWSNPDPYRVTGLRKDLHARWVNNNRIQKFIDEGYVILKKDSSMAKDVEVGYDDSQKEENCFTYRHQTLMVCHVDLIKSKRTVLEKRNNAPFGDTLSGAVNSLGIRGVTPIENAKDGGKASKSLAIDDEEVNPESKGKK